MHRLIKYFALYTLFNLAFLSLAGEQAGHFSQIIEKLEIIVPTESADSSERLIRTIQARLKTKTGGIFSQSDFDSDLKMLTQDYDRVEPRVDSHEGKIYIQLKIWQNPQIRQIFWEGVEKVKRSTLQKELSIQEGSLFNRSTFSKQFNKIKIYYIKEGFFETEVTYDTVYDELTNEVEIYIRISEGRAGKIKNIVFCNFTKVEQAEILEMMVTKKYNFFMSWLTNEGVYNEDAIQHDRFIILNYLQNKGFADAKVNIEIQEIEESNRIVIQITADRCQSYSIREMSIEGNCIFSEEELRRCIKLCPGDAYSPEKLHLLCDCLMNFYGRFGYIEAAVTFEPKLVEGEHTFDVKILIDEGEQYCVGLIKVLGN
ncbi:MAG TPA: POTRA domain-containing protein, partial [Waddliaceae bacterium]